MNIKQLNEEMANILEAEVISVGDEVALRAENAMKSIEDVLVYIDDVETISKLEEAKEILRNMVPHLQ